MDTSQRPVTLDVVAPIGDAARTALRACTDDVASRWCGRQAADAEIAAALREDPSDDLAPPYGVFLVARQGDDVVGCGGLRLLPSRLGEVKRVFVAPTARNRGLGRRVMAELEHLARGPYSRAR